MLIKNYNLIQKIKLMLIFAFAKKRMLYHIKPQISNLKI